MKTITILSPAHPYRGGLASFTEMLARTFAKRGTKTNIITFRMQYPEWLFPGKTQYSESPAPAGLSIVRMVSSINPVNWWRTGRRIRKTRPDALIIRYWTPFMAPCLGSIARIASRNRHTIIIALLDNIIPHEKHLCDRILTRYFVKSVHGFIYMSQQVKDELNSFTGASHALFAPHPLFSNFGKRIPRNEACAHLQLPENMHYIMFFGLIRDYKGLDLMLDAWANLRNAGHTAQKRLIIAGEFYTDKTRYIRQMQHLGIENEVLMHDRFIRDEDVKYYFSAADMLVQPYRSATQSGVTQIAYHFDLPMIVTRVGGLPETVSHGKTGYLTEPDAAQIAGAIIKMYENNHLTQMAEGVAAEKDRFSWENYVRQIEKLHGTIIIARKTEQNS